MSARYYEIPTGEDSVHLLSNPMNDDEGVDINDEALPQLCNGNDESDCRHCHHISSAEWDDVDSQLPRHKLILTMCLCLLFMMAEIGGGYIAGSLAVITDGAHLMIDLIGFFISFLAISLSRRNKSTAYNYGFFRIEVLTTMVSISLIWAITLVFIYLATVRLINSDYAINANMMVIVSTLGVLINIIMFVVLHGQCHISHSHSHMSVLDSHDVIVSDKQSQNINLRAATMHVIGDLVQSIGVCISSLVIKFYPQAKFMDPVCTYIFSIIVIFSTTRLLRDSLHILMEGFPTNFTYQHILKSLQLVPGVCHVHALSVWSLTLDKNALTVHLAVDDEADRDLVLYKAQRIVTKKFGITFSTIQVEKHHDHCTQTCALCKPLAD